MALAPSKLDQTNNLLALYLHQCGETEVPKLFHVWSCLSIIAASVADRVGLEKFKGSLLAPNLYVILIGPSGLGKGEAIGAAMKFVAENRKINAFQGKATAPYLLDYLGKKHNINGKRVIANPKLFLITPELSMSVGKGDYADGFIKLMTELYTSHTVPIREGTRTGGSVTILDPCLPGDVEVLTPIGWQRLDTLPNKATTAVWKDYQIVWEETSTVRVPYKGPLLGWKEELHDCAYTPNHNLAVISGRRELDIVSRRATDLRDTGEFKIPTSGFFHMGKKHDPPFLRLMAAIQADGCINDGYIVIGLKKPRKIQRLRALLKLLKIDGHERLVRGGNKYFSIYAAQAKPFMQMFGLKKVFGPWLLDYDQESLNAFITEVVHWDGHQSRQGGRRNGYSSVHRENAEWVATIAHLTNRSAYLVQRSSAWYVTIREQFKTGLNKVHQFTEQHNGTVYCLKTSTGYFVARRNGQTFVTGNCINWLGGTTKEWLIDCVPKDAIMGGFFGRTVAVTATYDLNKRLRRPIYPHDVDEVREHVESRFWALSRVAGTFTMTKEAEEIEDRWYTQRPAPEDEALIPSWRREHDLTLKLSMILSLADGATFSITAHHMVQAQRLTAMAMAGMPKLISAASTTLDTVGLRYVTEIVEKVGRVQHSVLLRHVQTRGINASKLREIVDTLTQSKLIARLPLSGRGVGYIWIGSRKMPKDTPAS